MTDANVRELQDIFSDQLNYTSSDPMQPINPITYRTPEGETCLHIAAIRGDTRAIALLIDLGLDINAKGDMGNTPLHYARSHKHQDAYQLLLGRGASKDVRNDFGQLAG